MRGSALEGIAHEDGVLALGAGGQKSDGRLDQFLHPADVASNLDFLENSVDLLVSNPPYVESDGILRLAPEVRDWDPRHALDGGPDGLTFYRRIFAEAHPLLRHGADVVLEVGDGQAEAVLELGSNADFTPLGSWPDLTDTPRAVLLRWGR